MKPADVLQDPNVIVSESPVKKSNPIAFAATAVIGMIALIVLIHIGFSKSYIQYFPKFQGNPADPIGRVSFNWIMHVHGIFMMSWVILLLVQPILIRTGKRALHRRVGKLGYIVAPLVVLGIYLANYDAYHHTLQTAGQAAANAMISLTFPGLVFFATLYSLAMYYRNNPALHMRFMCSTAFLFIPPALDRTLIYYFQLPGYDVGSFIELSIIGLVVIYDSYKTKRLSAFALVFSFELLHMILWNIKETPAWQLVGGWISNIF